MHQGLNTLWYCFALRQRAAVGMGRAQPGANGALWIDACRNRRERARHGPAKSRAKSVLGEEWISCCTCRICGYRLFVCSAVKDLIGLWQRASGLSEGICELHSRSAGKDETVGVLTGPRGTNLPRRNRRCKGVSDAALFRMTTGRRQSEGEHNVGTAPC